MGKLCIICGKWKKKIFLLSDGFTYKNSKTTISDTLSKCYNIQFPDKDCKELLRICEKCIASLKVCYSFRKDVERAYQTLYGCKVIDKEYEIKIEDQYDEQHNEYELDDREYIESYSNDDNKINNQCLKSECPSDVDEDAYRSDWSVDTDDVLRATGYQTEVTTSHTKKKIEIPYLHHNSTKCPVCGKAFALYSSLVRHHTTHFPTHLCHICGHTFSSITNLNLHMVSHNGASFDCTKCSRKFKNKIAMNTHYKITHLGIDRYMCHKCNQRFKRVKEKIKHLVEVHNMQSSKYQCLHCEFRFTTDSEHRSHLKDAHFDVHNIKCEECVLVFLTRDQLRKHNIKHSGVKEFKCKFCTKEFGRRDHYKQHLRIHLEIKDFSCNVCGKSFVQKAAMQSHLKTHIDKNNF